MAEMTNDQRFAVMELTIRKMGKFLRDYPPQLEAFWENNIPMDILVGGAARDPQGTEWVNYWLYEAHKEVVGRNES